MDYNILITFLQEKQYLTDLEKDILYMDENSSRNRTPGSRLKPMAKCLHPVGRQNDENLGS